MYNWSSAAYIYMRLSWLFLWPTFYRQKSDPAILCRQQTFFNSRPRAAIVPYRHVDRDNILLRWYQLPCIGAVQPQTVPHIVIACLSMDVCALVTSSSSSWSPPHKSGLAHTAPLTRSRFIRTCSCWFLTPPKKVSQHHPPVTHTHTGLIRNERRKSESFCKTSAFGLYVHNLHATWWFLDPQRVKRSTDFVRCHFTNVCLTNSINHLGRLRVNPKKNSNRTPAEDL